MSVKGTSYANFRRALASRNLTIIRAAAAELPQVPLADALEVCVVMAERDPDLYPRAAARWLARYVLDRDVGLDEVESALDALLDLPERPSESYRQLAARVR